MPLQIKEINDKTTWENFLERVEEKTFLQSWNWGEFSQAMGEKIWRLGVFGNDRVLAVALVVKIAAKRGTFLLIQHGPAFAKAASFADLRSAEGFGKARVVTEAESAGKPVEILETLLKKLKVIAIEEKASFIRIAPLWEENEQNEKALKSLGFIGSPMHANAYTATWKLDISQSEDQLLARMRKTTRYLIRQAENNLEVAVEKKTDENALGLYQELNFEVAKRQNFAPFSPESIRGEFEAFAKDGQVQLFLGKYKGETLAGALVIFWSGLAFYHQAASSEKGAKIPLPYLILWKAIKEAKSRECRAFDFWGFVDPKKQPRHPWAGPTLFKMGFGGEAKKYVKTQDLVISKKYWLTYAFEKIRKLKRGL